jgi:hypothetical protein
VTDSVARELVLYAECLPATPFRELVGAAAAAGFDAITTWPLIYRRAQSREGLDPSTMRRIAEDAGIRITDIDPCGDWLPASAGDDDDDGPTQFVRSPGLPRFYLEIGQSQMREASREEVDDVE